MIKTHDNHSAECSEPHNLKRGVIVICANCRKAEPELPPSCTPLPFEQQMSAAEIHRVESSLSRNQECSDPSCPCHEWSARTPSESPALPEREVDCSVLRAKNVLSGDSAPNSPILTIEQALAELREMFPTSMRTILITDFKRRVDFRISSVGLELGRGHTLADAMKQVRKWHKEQQ